MRIAKLRLILVVPYLVLTTISFYVSYFVPDNSPALFDIGFSGFMVLLLTFPWNVFVVTLMRLGGLESNLVANLGMAVCVAANAANLYYIGLKFERAPDRLV